ncbi:MAG: hypothetical protein CENE_01659 [Candidatus Celerinatantimonas neptuna]|nr:MAG: hypothetical protein CENE_01659 [Candidatus Celerinatantimonas neptuna]
MTSRVLDNEIALIRCAIWDDFKASSCINLGLWLQKGLAQIENKNKANDSTSGDSPAKTNHLNKMANLPAPKEYIHAFDHWFGVTQDETRFERCALTLENRLLIGLTGNGALETGCSLSRNYGMPYIPGSSIKGVVRAFVQRHLSEYASEISELLGSDDPDASSPQSALVTFHDAWWTPHGNNKPFVLDVVTTHHQAYYNGKSEKPSDKDSPIPNHLLAVQGSFLFVLEGAPEHTRVCATMLKKALQGDGIGAKTAAGYGYMNVDDDLFKKIQRVYQDRIREREDASLSPVQKRLRSLTKQLKAQIDAHKPDPSGNLREELKSAISDARSWNAADIQNLQEFAQKCIKFWDPKKKNKKLKELRQLVMSLTQN